MKEDSMIDHWTCGYLLGLLMGMLFYWWLIDDLTQDDAVEAGHAEYYIDIDHNKQFRWLDNYDG